MLLSFSPDQVAEGRKLADGNRVVKPLKWAKKTWLEAGVTQSSKRNHTVRVQLNDVKTVIVSEYCDCRGAASDWRKPSSKTCAHVVALVLVYLENPELVENAAPRRPSAAQPQRATAPDDLFKLAKSVKDAVSNPGQVGSKGSGKLFLKSPKKNAGGPGVIRSDDKLILDDETRKILDDIARSYAERDAVNSVENSLDLAFLVRDTVPGAFPEMKIFNLGSRTKDGAEVAPRASLWGRATLAQREINSIKTIVQSSVGRSDFEPAEYLAYFELWLFLLHRALLLKKCYLGTLESGPLMRGPDVDKATYVWRTNGKQIHTFISTDSGAPVTVWSFPFYVDRKAGCAGALYNRGMGQWYSTLGEFNNPSLEAFGIFSKLINVYLRTPDKVSAMLVTPGCQNVLKLHFPRFYDALVKQQRVNARPPLSGLRFTLSEEDPRGVPTVTPWLKEESKGGDSNFVEISWERVAVEGSLSQQVLAHKMLMLLKHATANAIKQSTVPYDIWLDLIERVVKTKSCYWKSPDSLKPLTMGDPVKGGTFWADEGENFRFRLVAAAGQQLLPCTSWFIPMYINQRTNHIGAVLNVSVGAPLESVRKLNLVPKDKAIAVSHYVHQLKIEKWVCPILTTITWKVFKPTPIIRIIDEGQSFGSGTQRRGRMLRLEFESADDRCNQIGDATHIYTADKEWLAACLSRVRSLGFDVVEAKERNSVNETLLPITEDSWKALRAEIKQLRKEGFEISAETETQLRPLILAESNFVIKVTEHPDRKKIDWFSLSLAIRIDGEEVNLLPILVFALRNLPDELTPADIESLNENGRFNAVLNDGRLVALPFDCIRTILLSLHQFLRRHRSKSGDIAMIPALQAWYLRSSGLFASSLHSVCEKLTTRMELANVLSCPQQLEPSSGFCGELRDYQKRGLWWLDQIAKAEGGGILADDMGLGKTVQVIAKIELDKSTNSASLPVLIVCPTSMLHNWASEFEKFAPHLMVFQYAGGARHKHKSFFRVSDVVLTTYGTLLQDRLLLTNQMLWHGVYLDEAQRIKNPGTEISKVVKELIANHRFCVTGTPIENNLGELWSHFDFVMPGFLNEKPAYDKYIRTPAESGNEAVSSVLRNMTRPFILRRLKSEVRQDLPEKIETTICVQLTGKQALLYESHRLLCQKDFRKEVERKGFPAAKNLLLTIFHKLRQVCLHPGLLKLEATEDVVENAKFEALLEKIDDLLSAGKKILIFSQYVSMLAFIGDALRARSISFVELIGENSPDLRNRNVQKFQETDVPVFLISLLAGGEGLNLPSADAVIIYEPWWTPAKENQAIDRAHRIGQLKNVSVFRFIAKGTIEERMVELQKVKQARSDLILNSDEAMLRLTTKEDIERLFEPLADDSEDQD